MADVFISYAREDRARAADLARVLEEAGLSVWWDRALGVGDDFGRVIEAEVDAAKAIVVLWSQASVASKPVRAEAAEGLDRDILLPVLIEPVRPPLLFRAVQFEDLSDWSGAASAEAIQRLLIKATALAKGQTAAAGIAAAPGAVSRVSDERGLGPLRSPGSALTLIGVFGVAAALFVDPEDLVGGYWAAALGLASLAIAIFQFAEKDLSPSARAMATRWLQPAREGVRIGAAEAFYLLFERVFGRDPLSWRFFLSSLVGSLCSVCLIFLALGGIGDFLRDPETAKDVAELGVVMTVFVFLIAISSMAMISNVFGDYLSLAQTRAVLLAARRYGYLPLFAVLDAVLTLLVFLASAAALVVIIFALGLLFPDPGLAPTPLSELPSATLAAIDLSAALQGLKVYFGVAPGRLDGPERGAVSLFIAMFCATFLTSAWIWLALVFAPIFRAVAWSQTSGASLIGKIFDVRRAPFAALGYVSAALILLASGAIWIIGRVLAATG